MKCHAVVPGSPSIETRTPILRSYHACPSRLSEGSSSEHVCRVDSDQSPSTGLIRASGTRISGVLKRDFCKSPDSFHLFTMSQNNSAVRSAS